MGQISFHITLKFCNIIKQPQKESSTDINHVIHPHKATLLINWRQIVTSRATTVLYFWVLINETFCHQYQYQKLMCTAQLMYLKQLNIFIISKYNVCANIDF